MGHIIGQIPPSVRHVIFDSALSSEAFQILCVFLRTQNEAWKNENNANPDHGLMGLAIKRQHFTKEDLDYLLEMLDPSLCNKEIGAANANTGGGGGGSRAMSFDDSVDPFKSPNNMSSKEFGTLADDLSAVILPSSSSHSTTSVSTISTVTSVASEKSGHYALGGPVHPENTILQRGSHQSLRLQFPQI